MAGETAPHKTDGSQTRRDRPMHTDISFVSLIRSANVGKPCLIEYVSYADIIQVSHIRIIQFCIRNRRRYLIWQRICTRNMEAKLLFNSPNTRFICPFVPSLSVSHIVFLEIAFSCLCKSLTDTRCSLLRFRISIENLLQPSGPHFLCGFRPTLVPIYRIIRGTRLRLQHLRQRVRPRLYHQRDSSFTV